MVDEGGLWSTVERNGGYGWAEGGAGVFLGTYSLRLDEKGRLFLPAKWRAQMAEGLVVTPGQEHCLYVFDEERFAVMSQEPRVNTLTERKSRNYERLLFAAAHDDTPDKQGRITIPGPLKAYAGLDRDCTVIGANSRVEIWNNDAWAQLVADNVDDYAALDEGGPQVVS